ncbi:hypothetical protein BDV98DRAFT_654123 [Pterulicium gracile]|uniref:Tim44-like domain-containing protein n=1 Tax=Pterulicium gracile TaxID=1884261 RepID=A0A5C3QVL5_9AGAR|nr:hypothetical protein BDV98DRAFT_654123 [Pterula gracilis]
MSSSACRRLFTLSPYFSPSSTRLYATRASRNADAHHTSGAVPVNVGKNAPSPTAHKKAHTDLSHGQSTSPKNTVLGTSAHQGKPALPSAGAVEKTATPTPTELNAEDQLKQLDQITMMERMAGHLDIWGQRVETLDVEIPYSVHPKHMSSNGGIRGTIAQALKNFENGVKNSVSIYRLAMENSIPGLDLPWPNRRQRWFLWPYQALRVSSTDPSKWIAPFRETIALETYKAYNTALASGDTKSLKRLTTDSFQDRALKLLRSRPSGQKFTWKHHSTLSPPTVLSIRVMEGHLGTEGPRVGNRLMAHVLVRFDTEQSITRYDAQGRTVGKPSAPQRVTEYLVFEKRMWYNDPWAIREQLFEGVGKGPLAV